MAYRDDVQALEARVAALSADLAAREHERDEVARMLEEARARANAEAFLADLESGGPARRRRDRFRIAAVVAGLATLALIVGGLMARGSHRDHDFEAAMRQFERFSDEMCQCKDNACVTHVSDEMTRWSMAMQKEWEPAPKLSDEQMKRATEIGEHMGECMQKAMSAGDPQQLAH